MCPFWDKGSANIPGEGGRSPGQKYISVTCSANPLSPGLARFSENSRCSVNVGLMGAVLLHWAVFVKGRAQVTREADHCHSLPRVPLDKLGWCGRTISEDTAKLCSLLSSISPGDPRDQGSPRTLGPGRVECGVREALNPSHVWEPSEKSLILDTVTLPAPSPPPIDKNDVSNALYQKLHNHSPSK